MKLRAHCSRALALAAALLLAGCQRTIELRTAPVGEDVRLVLGRPRTLAIVRPEGDTLPVAAVVRVDGRVLSVRDDDIELRVSSLAAANEGTIRPTDGSRVVVPSDAAPRIEQRKTSVMRTTLAVVGFSIAFFALGIALGGGGP